MLWFGKLQERIKLTASSLSWLAFLTTATLKNHDPCAFGAIPVESHFTWVRLYRSAGEVKRPQDPSLFSGTSCQKPRQLRIGESLDLWSGVQYGIHGTGGRMWRHREQNHSCFSLFLPPHLTGGQS